MNISGYSNNREPRSSRVSAAKLDALADRIGADKLDLIRWAREDIVFARLIASKVRI